MLTIGILRLSGVFLIAVPFTWLGAYYVQKNWLTQKIAVTFSGDKMNISYVSQPSFDNQPDKSITAADITGLPSDFDIVKDKIMAMIGAGIDEDVTLLNKP